MKFAAIFLGIEGRLNRLSYLLSLILVAALYLLFIYIINTVFAVSNNNLLPLHILNIITFIIFIFLTIKRYHDFNKSGFFTFIYIIVIYVISQAAFFLLMYLDAVSFYKHNIIDTIIYAVFLLYLVLKPGTSEVNKYGNKPKKLFDLGLHNFEEKKSSITADR